VPDGPQKEEAALAAGPEAQQPAEHPSAGSFQYRVCERAQGNGSIGTIQYEGLKQAVDAQKMAMKSVDIDKMMDIQDEMLDMKMQSDMMNEMLGRNYDCDIDEEEFED
jgi:hypothetical protein